VQRSKLRDPKPATRAAASMYHDFLACTCICCITTTKTTCALLTRATRCLPTLMRLSVYTLLVVPLFLSLLSWGRTGDAVGRIEICSCLLPRMPCFFHRAFLTNLPSL
jgi:hypothetical protein